MGLPSGEPVHARHRDGPDRRHDPREAPAHEAAAQRRLPARLIARIAGVLLALALGLAPRASAAAPLRIATFDVELARRGPGLLLRDIVQGKDPQVAAAVAVIARANPDVLLLTGIDYDLGLAALRALRDRLAGAGAVYPDLFALQPNTGVPTGTRHRRRRPALADRATPRATAASPAQGGMALLSRAAGRPRGEARFLRPALARPARGAVARRGAERCRHGRCSACPTTGHWDVALRRPAAAPLHLLAFAAAPPVFDGPEDRNGRRNHDEIAFWQALLDGALPMPPPPAALRGARRRQPRPCRRRGPARGDPGAAVPIRGFRIRRRAAPAARTAATPGQTGDPALDTADWPEDGGPGNLRVDYVLPSAGLKVTGAGVFWPAPGALGAGGRRGARHRWSGSTSTCPRPCLGRPRRALTAAAGTSAAISPRDDVCRAGSAGSRAAAGRTSRPRARAACRRDSASRTSSRASSHTGAASRISHHGKRPSRRRAAGLRLDLAPSAVHARRSGRGRARPRTAASCRRLSASATAARGHVGQVGIGAPHAGRRQRRHPPLRQPLQHHHVEHRRRVCRGR